MAGPSDRQGTTKWNRRSVLGAVGTGALAGVAGCTGGPGEDTDTPGDDTPASGGDTASPTPPDTVPAGVPTKLETNYWNEKQKPRSETEFFLKKTAEPGERIGAMPILYEAQDTGWIDQHMVMVREGMEALGWEGELNPKGIGELIQELIGYGMDGAVMYLLRSARPEDASDVASDMIRRRCDDDPVFYCDPELDDLIERMTSEMDPEKRQELIEETQLTIVDDYISTITLFPDVLSPVNTATFEGYVNSQGNGTAQVFFPWTDVNVQPKTDRRTLLRGVLTQMEGTNIPWGQKSGPNARLLTYVYGLGFFTLTPDLEIIGNLATDMEVVDDTTYDFELRDGVTWHDGEPFGPDDVKFSTELYIDTNATQIAQYWENLEEENPVEIISESGGGVVRLNTQNPDPLRRNIRSIVPLFIPKHIWQDVDDPANHNPDPPIGVGPFTFESWDKGSQLTLSRYEDHWYWDEDFRSEVLGDQFASGPGIERTKFINTGNVDSLIGALEQNQIDLIPQPLTINQFDRATQPNHIERTESPGIAPLYGWINHTLPPLRDATFRRAWLQYAFDIETFIEEVLQGTATKARAHNLVPPHHRQFAEDTPSWSYEPEKGREVLSKAGYTWDDQGRIQYPDGKAWAAFVERYDAVNMTREELGQPDFS